MYYVYILNSSSEGDHYYVGSTGDLKARLSAHNRGESAHTKKYLPWELMTYIAFGTGEKARRFENYLKSGSGRAFAKKHF